jgi:hypothetical protein
VVTIEGAPVDEVVPVVLEAEAEELDWPVDEAEAGVEDEVGWEVEVGFVDVVGDADVGVGRALEEGGRAVLDGVARTEEGVAAKNGQY